jgi:hypothetical protein
MNDGNSGSQRLLGYLKIEMEGEGEGEGEGRRQKSQWN